MNALHLLGSGLIVLSLLMVLTWIAARKLNNAGIVDLVWSFGFFVATALYLFEVHPTSSRQWIIALAYMISSLRLTWHLGTRFKRWFPKEDPRYTAFKTQMGKHANGMLLLVFLWQGAILILLTAPLAVSLADQSPTIGLTNELAIFLWLIALIGESVADFQLTRFASNPAHEGLTCQEGLWHYSRHPNYFFEWLISVAFFVYATASPYGLLTGACPLILLHLLLNVTGVKPSEEHSFQSRADYKLYAARTSIFVPWPPKALHKPAS